MKRKNLWLLPMILAMMLLSNSSCVKENNDTNIYGNSMLWVSIDNSSMEAIGNFEIQFTTKSVQGEVKDHNIVYTKSAGFIAEGPLSFPTTMQGGWVKVYEGLDETDLITIVYNGNKYTTRGYKFPEQRCIKVNLKTTSVGGEFGITDYDITIIEQTIDVANLNRQDYGKIDFFYPTLLYCDIRRNGTRYEG